MVDLTTALGVLSRAFPESLDLGQSCRLSTCISTVPLKPVLLSDNWEKKSILASCLCSVHCIIRDLNLPPLTTQSLHHFWMKSFDLRAHSWKLGGLFSASRHWGGSLQKLKPSCGFVNKTQVFLLQCHDKAWWSCLWEHEKFWTWRHCLGCANVLTWLSPPSVWKLNLKASQVK